MYSTESPYMIQTDDKVYWLQQLILSLKDGKLDSYYWDNNCTGCTDKCDEQTVLSTDYLGEEHEYKHHNCYMSYCTTSATDAFTCNLRVMVMWAGTDSSGNNLTSSTMRIANFKYNGASTMYDAMKKDEVDDLTASTTIANTDASTNFNLVS